MDGRGVGNCGDRRAAFLFFGAKLGAPLSEDIVHHASVSASANSPSWKIGEDFKISDADLGQEPWCQKEKRVGM